MEKLVSCRPNLYLETADLICAYVNGIEPQYLTEEGPNCIPAKEVERMMKTVCGDLNLSSGVVKLFFQGYRLEGSLDDEHRLVCVANTLLNSCMMDSERENPNAQEALQWCYLSKGKPYRINSFGKAGFGWDPCEEFCSISDELDKLAISDGLRLRLTEVLSHYNRYVEYLCDLLEPLAQRLELLLAPWMPQLQSQSQQWQQALDTDDMLQNFLSRFNADMPEVRQIVMRPRLFFPSACTGHYSGSKVLFCYAGIGLRIGQAKKPTLAPSELAALRQLSGADRIDMLRVMVGKRMGARELARKLNINPGTVFRDLNSMHMPIC